MESLGVTAPLEQVLQAKEPFALYHINRKLSLEPKVLVPVDYCSITHKRAHVCIKQKVLPSSFPLPQISVNARVVVVGAGDTGMAFLETLVFRCVCVL